MPSNKNNPKDLPKDLSELLPRPSPAFPGHPQGSKKGFPVYGTPILGLLAVCLKEALTDLHEALKQNSS